MRVIYGINPLREALKGHGMVIRKLVIATGRGGEPIRKIIELAKKTEVPVEYQDRDYLDRQTKKKSHQGVMGFCDDFVYVSVDDVITNRHRDCKYDLILILDGVTDPQNLGSMIRTAYCFGVNGLIIPKDRSAHVTAAVIKASSGTAGSIPVAMEVNLSSAIEYLKGKGFWIYGADAVNGQNIHATNYRGHIAVVMGSEGKGIRPLIRKKCDYLLSIPMRGEIDSLNVSVAAGIILHEILKTWCDS